ncbi:MAG: hypothetical protein Q9218_000560 [Villophora microphyllina]
MSPPNGHDDDPDSELGDLVIIDDVFKARAKDKIQTPLIAFPKSERGASDFEFFTGQDLDRIIEHAARHYMRAGLRVNENRRVAVLGPTNIEWVANFFGLLRAGFAVVTLSPRISAKAIANLLSETQCGTVIYTDTPQFLRTIDQVKDRTDVQATTMLRRVNYDKPPADEPDIRRDIVKTKEAERAVVILHSSGSTGLPKPIYTSHKRYTGWGAPPANRRTKEFMTLPLYHAFPMGILPWKLYTRNTVYFMNANIPLTHDTVTKALTAAQPDIVYAVPYILKLLVESPDSVEVLRSCDQVLFIGSQCPDELGDRLVSQGINLGTWLGATEIGTVGTSVFRPPGDKEWAYLRIDTSKMRHIWPRPVADNQYEFVYLKDYPLRVESNSDDPPESFYSKDIFTPHSTIPNAWKYLGRLDDRVTLINGEKVLPLPIEGHIKRHPLVREAVVFGVARPMPGLLAFRADKAKDLTDEEFIKEIWSDVEGANRDAEGFSQISKDMIVPLPADVEYPQADKGSIIRPQMYRAFEEKINEVYDRLEQQQEGTLVLDIPGLEEHLLDIGRDLVGQQLENKNTDFFSAGMDSLCAIQMRGLIVHDLDLGGNSRKLSQNIVFETSNVENLAEHLHNLRQGQTAKVQDWKIVAKGMIQKHTVFQKHRPGSQRFPDRHVVVLTGATGGLGSHLLSQLSSSPSICKIYCLLRGSEPLARLQKSLQDRKLSFDPSKTVAATADLGHPSLGLSKDMFSEIQSSASHIIHAAWPVNFQLPLQSFEPHIQGLHNILQLSLSSPYTEPAKLIFCSSVSTALGTPAPARIPEEIIQDLAHVSEMGYGQSKLVGEYMVAAAVEKAGAKASCLRIGQVVGDTKYGMWNDREAYPAIVRSALTMGVLPQLGVECEWLPVDTLAEIVGELAGFEKTNNGGHESNGISEAMDRETPGRKRDMELIYNITSPHTFSWTTSFLPALRSAGLEFDTVPFDEWIQRLRSLSSSSKPPTNPAAADPDKNPALKLFQYYASAFTDKDEKKDGRVVFEIEKAMTDSDALKAAEDVIKSGLVGKMVGWWMERWTDGGTEEDRSKPVNNTHKNNEAPSFWFRQDGWEAGRGPHDRGPDHLKKGVAWQNGHVQTTPQVENEGGAKEEIGGNPVKATDRMKEEVAGQLVNGDTDEQTEEAKPTLKRDLKEELRAELLADVKAELKAQLKELKAELLAEIKGMLKENAFLASNEKMRLVEDERVTADGSLELEDGTLTHDAVAWKEKGDRELENAMDRGAVEAVDAGS